MKSATVLVYVQHLLGIGHQMRAAAIVRAMRAQGLNVTCVSGGEPAGMPDLGGARLIQLPPLRAADSSFRRLVDEMGREIDAEGRARRRDALLSAFRDVRPGVLLIESFPFARWQFRFELLPLLQAAREKGVRVAASVRDILVAKDDPTRVDAIVDILRESFDAVLVHGDPRLVSLDATFGAADRIADLIHYTGYVAPPPPDIAADGPGAGEVVVAAGGGAVGGTLLRTALAARPLTKFASSRWRLITGPNLPPAERQALAAPRGVTIDTMRDDYREILGRAALSVSQAGYNTVMDILVAGARAVLVPFSTDTETEQRLRARLLAARGRVQVISESGLSPSALAQAIDTAAEMPRPDPPDFSLDGANGTARLVAALLTRTPARNGL
ncbi:MAG: glycosyl transferase [Rhodospirillales bacterium]|nr:MAG: glycosyl transferase [Rhodospirillales bacterium]